MQRRDADVHVHAVAQAREYEAAADRIAREAHGPVLDWGCGLGQVSALLLDRGVDVTSYDYDPEATGLRQRPLPRFPQVHAWHSAEPVRLPFEDAAFATVLSMGVLEHVQDPDASLEELKRVLRPGGTLYVYKLPNRRSYLEWTARRLDLWHHGVGEYDVLYLLDEAVELVQRHGYAVREARWANMLPLTLTRPRRPRVHDAVWRANRALARVPGLNLLSTNVELVATAPR